MKAWPPRWMVSTKTAKGAKASSRRSVNSWSRALHSFHTGAENIFKRVAVELDGEPVRGDAWRRELLPRMKTPAARRPALLSEELHDTLKEDPRFRHVFGSAYSFDLDWRKMSPLVLRLEGTFQKLEKALDDFLK